MVEFFKTLWSEVQWVFSPTKYGIVRPEYSLKTLLYPLPIAFGLLSLRYVLNRCCFAPFGVYLGLKPTRSRPAIPNPLLEVAYPNWNRMSRSQILGIAKQVDMSERQVERWMRQRRKQERPSELVKFCASCWKCFYYCCLFAYGLVTLLDKPWLWDISQCWSDFEHQVVTSDIWWYYMFSLGFYWSLLFGQFFLDAKRKDFWEMFVHHIAAILLMSFSWLTGAYRIGTVVLVLHDCGDIFLEAAKMAKYADYQLTCTVVFSLFAVVWIVTRLGIYPLWIVKHTVFDVPKLVPNFAAYYIFNGLLLTLLVLHCYWSYLIMKIMVAMVWAGEVERDIRSSSEDDE